MNNCFLFPGLRFSIVLTKLERYSIHFYTFIIFVWTYAFRVHDETVIWKQCLVRSALNYGFTIKYTVVSVTTYFIKSNLQYGYFYCRVSRLVSGRCIILRVLCHFSDLFWTLNKPNGMGTGFCKLLVPFLKLYIVPCNLVKIYKVPCKLIKIYKVSCKLVIWIFIWQIAQLLKKGVIRTIIANSIYNFFIYKFTD